MTNPRLSLSPLRQFLISAILLMGMLTACDQGFFPIQNTPIQSTPEADITVTAAPPTVRTSTSTPEPASTITVQPSELKGLNLTLWHFWSGPTEVMLDELVTEFNRDNEWGIRVEPAYQGGVDDIHARMRQALNTGEMPHLVAGYTFQALDWRTVRDLFVDLQGYVSDPIWGMPAETTAGFYPAFWDADVVDGARLGVPAMRTIQVVFYNQSWGRELGYETPPTTLESFQKQVCAAGQSYATDDIPENDGSGGWIVSTSYATSLAWLDAFQAEVLAPEGQGYQFDTSQALQAFRFQRNLFENGCAWQNPESDDIAAFGHRKGLVITGSLADLAQIDTAFKQAANPDKWTVLPFPATNGNPTLSAYGPSYYILESSDAEQLASWLFLRWILSPQIQARFAGATNTLPLSEAATQQARAQSSGLAQWQTALDLLPYIKNEPTLRSWLTVRWMLSDANGQLFQWYFTQEQLPATLSLLDETANEIHSKMK